MQGGHLTPSPAGTAEAPEHGLVGCQPHARRARPQPTFGSETRAAPASLSPQTQPPIIALPAADTALRAMFPSRQDKRAKVTLGSTCPAWHRALAPVVLSHERMNERVNE